ncbi:MAG: hypothetical protein EOO11_18150 [Chitinophagaceae bacterium]|nr:MAG: hypothetical protein EOO11_18150 [Chitinophagaceae bacterium]
MPVAYSNGRLLRASIEYMALLLTLAGGLLYHNATAYRARCTKVEGVVIDQVGSYAYALNRSGIKPRPLFRYQVGEKTYEAVPPNVSLPVGARAPLLAQTDDPLEVRVYDFSYWVSFGFDTFPIFLFGGVAYAGLLVHALRLRRKLHVLAILEERLARASG